ncbi:Transcription termination factor mitochondrial/chloroplastic [Arabidopsis suecica]|uniref:Transcription termination factor mitochondrial/chloroplastic n=1 Tax=Arabidopsis suecica TaxID=45249 RepID=A0A8T2BQV8_ARASU|nr:Transcription termination factor mitochondrial/chloroplastic [Arabidopsis suecica]
MCSLILHGRRLVQLQKWCHSSFSVQKASSSAASDALVNTKDCRKGEIFTVSYLVLVDSLGLTRKLAESISEGKANPESVLSLLTSHGFTDSQISSIITIYPRLFLLDAKKSLAPKLKFLQSRGASSFELTEIVSKVPEILTKKGDKTLSRYYDFVKVIVEADKSSSKYEKLCHSLPVGNLENKIRNISVLRELGVPQRLLFPLLISSGGHVNGKERFGESIKKLVEMGFDPTTTKFVKALRIVQGLSEKTMEEKANLYKSLGFDDVWEIFNKYPIFLALSEKNILNSVETFQGLGFSRDEFVNMVKSFPQGIGLSAETVKKKTDFLVKKMNWPLKALVSNPEVLGYNMEKRIVPRCNVIKALMSKGLLGDTGSKLPPIGSVLKCTNQVFFKRYVIKHNDKKLVAELMTILTGDRAS